jgi:hypothetical protein
MAEPLFWPRYRAYRVGRWRLFPESWMQVARVYGPRISGMPSLDSSGKVMRDTFGEEADRV